MLDSFTRSPLAGLASPGPIPSLMLAFTLLSPGLNAQQLQVVEPQVVPGPITFPGTVVINNTQPGTTLNIQSCAGVPATGLCATAPPSALNFVITPDAGWEARIITATGSPANYNQLATQGVANLMISRGLTPGTSSNDGVDSGYKRFVVSRRSDARSGAFLAIVDAIQTVPFQRSARQTESLNYLADQLKRKRISAARIALDEFYKWRGSPCNYVPPAGFTYNPGPDCAGQTLGTIFIYQRPVPPVAEYGAVLAFPELATVQGGRALSESAARLTAAASSIAVGGPAGMAFPRIAPSLADQLSDLVEPYREDYGGARPPIRTAFLRFAGPVGALLSTVVDVVMAGLDLAKYEQLEGNLKKAVAREEAAVVDLSQEILSSRGLPQLFSTFIAGTLFNGPDPANSYPVPERGALQLKLVDPNGSSVWDVPAVTYRTWDDSVWQASISPSGWFVHAALNATQGHTDTVMQYMDWNNVPRTATYNPFTRLFTVTDRNGMAATSTTSLQIKLANTLNVKMTATLPLPPSTKFSVTEFRFGVLSGSADKEADVISYMAPTGQLWTARRSGSTFVHQPSQGGASHSSNGIDLVLTEGAIQNPILVAASCTVRPAGSSTNFLCTPQDKTFVPRYANSLRYFLDGITVDEVKLRP